MDSISEIPMSHLMDLAYLFRTGVIGWQADARQSYLSYTQQHNLIQTLIQVNSKKYRAKKPQQFHKLFPEHAELAQLGKKPTNLAAKWAAASAILSRSANNGKG